MKKTKILFSLITIILLLGLFNSCDKSELEDTSISFANVADKPPMGWNSYLCYANDVTEEQVKANADYMAEQLKEFGWEYIVIDVDWYKSYDSIEVRGGNASIDAYGRFIPDKVKYPSSNYGAGLKPLADYIHSKGLKLGIHIMRGVPKAAVDQKMKIFGTQYNASEIAEPNNLCDWNKTMMGINYNHPGGQAYIQSMIDLYAEWGVDYIKADDMTAPVYQADEITAISQAIKNSKRAIVFSLSPGPSPIGAANHLSKNANLWRVCNDFWDTWQDLHEQFSLVAPWVPYINDNGWPDADMLPIGKLRKSGVGEWEANKLNTTPEDATDEFTRFTKDEQITMMNLWSMFRSPLMIGGNLPENDEFTLSLLTNKQLIDINQGSTNNKIIYQDEYKSIWTADSENGKYKYLAIFNISENLMEDNIILEDVGLGKNKEYILENIWSKEQTTVTNKILFTLKKHTSQIYRIKI